MDDMDDYTITKVEMTFEYSTDIINKMIDDLHALMWHSGDGCEICKYKVVKEKKPYRSLSCSLKVECEPVYEGLTIIDRKETKSKVKVLRDE